MRVRRSQGPVDPGAELGGIIRAVKGLRSSPAAWRNFHSRMLAAMVSRNYADPSVSLDTVSQIHLPSLGEVLIFAYGFEATSC